MGIALAYRSWSVLRGDADAIRLAGSDPRATDQTLPLMFLAVLAATARHAVSDPVAWLVSAFFVAGLALIGYTASMWLIGKAFEGTGRFLPLFRLAGFSVLPLALGLIPGYGLAVGALWTFALAARVLWVLHVQETQVAVVTAVLPSMFIIAVVVAVAAQTVV